MLGMRASMTADEVEAVVVVDVAAANVEDADVVAVGVSVEAADGVVVVVVAGTGMEVAVRVCHPPWRPVKLPAARRHRAFGSGLRCNVSCLCTIEVEMAHIL
jgi:glucokinase